MPKKVGKKMFYVGVWIPQNTMPDLDCRVKKEGTSRSEWIRNLVLNDLKKSGN